MGWLFKSQRQPKTALLLMEEELVRQHKLTNGICTQGEAQREIARINLALRDLVKLELSNELEARLKRIEDSIADLYLTGRDK